LVRVFLNRMIGAVGLMRDRVVVVSSISLHLSWHTITTCTKPIWIDTTRNGLRLIRIKRSVHPWGRTSTDCLRATLVIDFLLDLIDVHVVASLVLSSSHVWLSIIRRFISPFFCTPTPSFFSALRVTLPIPVSISTLTAISFTLVGSLTSWSISVPILAIIVFVPTTSRTSPSWHSCL